MEGYSMRLDGKSKELVGVFAICAVLIVSGCFYLDTRLARFISEVVGAGFLFSRPIANMPDCLFSLVCTLTCMSWAARLFLSLQPAWRRYAQFVEYLGSALPIAYVMKTALKDVFGRTNTRVWLLHPNLLAFHWFRGGADSAGFPSGHMAIFTVLMLGISRYFPRLGRPCAGLLLALALALMITQYHFLSDVAAGVSVGVIVDLLIRWGLSFLHRLEGAGF